MEVHITVDKQGETVLSHNIDKYGYIKLKYISMYFQYYNVPKDITVDGKTLKAGYYYVKDLENKGFTFDSITKKINKEIPGLTKDKFAYLNPLTYKLYVDEIDQTTNYYKNKRSKLLCNIPINITKFGEVIHYEPYCITKKISHIGNILHVKILDEKGEEFPGKFVAEFSVC